MKLFATCDAGLEEVLEEELRGLGASDLRLARRGVAFQGGRRELFRINVASRLATRILVQVATFDVADRQDLYLGAVEVDWGQWIGPRSTISVTTRGGTDQLTNTAFISQVVKDAVCDRLRKDRGTRPNVDRRSADVPIAVHIANGRCALSVDSSGARLHRRGYRREGGEAPLRETLAAGVLALAGWDGSRSLLDPMCGSGTFVIEAALAARRIPPGRRRASARRGGGFAFNNWPDHNRQLFGEVVRELDRAVLPRSPVQIVGYDSDATAVAAARRNVERAGLEDDVVIFRRSLDAAEPIDEKGVLITNPPYGARLSDPKSLVPLYRSLGDVLKQRFSGYDAWVLTGNLSLAKSVGLRPSRRIELWNGTIECRLLHYELYRGSKSPR